MRAQQLIMLGFITSVVAYLASRNPTVREFASRIAQKTSNVGIDLIKQWEGFEEKPYDDIAGHKTIGYGTLLTPGHPLWGVPFISESVASGWLRKHVNEKIDPVISRLVKVPLTQNQYDAISSFIYNLGEGNFKSSTLLKKLNAKDYQGAADEFPRWNKARVAGVLQPVQGLTNRRNAERSLFLS